jgi:hypothetical protein
MLDAPKFVINVLMVTCIHFSQCALNQVNGGWIALANTPRYEMQNKFLKCTWKNYHDWIP